MDITQADKEFRQIGDVDFDTVVMPLLTAMNSPMLAAAQATHVAAQPMTALFWAQGKFENQEETTGQIVHPSDHNPVTLRPWVDGNGKPCDPRTSNGLPPGAVGVITAPNGTFYLQFGSDGACAAEWKHRLTDPSYKNGVYTGAHTLKDMLNIYCPPGDKHAITGDDANAAYYPAVMATLKQFAAANGDTSVTSPPPATSGGPPVATTPTVRGKVPLPPMIERWDVGNNHAIGTGRSDDGPRWGFIVGADVHTSDGTFQGNLQSFLNPTFGGMTDAQVGGPWDGQYNGVIMRFIDPHSQVIPWANGGVGPNCDGCVAPHGDGPAFLAKWASSGGIDWVVNGRLRSVETTDGRDPTVTKGGAQIEMLCFLLAYWHSEEAGQSWDQFSWRMSHWELGGNHQQCPGVWIKGHEKDINDRTVAIMKAYQTGTALNPPLQVTYPPNWTGGTVPLPGTTPAPVPAPAPTPAYTAAVKPAFWDQLQADGMYVDRGTVWFSSHESYTAQKATPRSTYAALASTLRAGPDLSPGDVVNPNDEPVAVGTSSSGGQWVISNAPNFTRFNLADLKP